MNTNDSNAALWQCDECGTWWCSQPAIAPTMFLLELPADLLEELGWENFRGWRLGGIPHVASCPECSETSPAPLIGSAPAGPQLRISLKTVLHPMPAAAPTT